MINTVPAVIIGAGLQGLGVVRSLARVGIRTVIVDTPGSYPAMWSRYGQKMTVDKLHGPVLVEGLLGLRAKLGYQPVLMFTNELSVATVSEHRDQLKEFCRFHFPQQDVVTMLLNKARFFEFAQQRGLPIPHTAVIKAGAMLDQLSAVPFPAVIKPAESRFRPSGEKMPPRRAATLREAEAVCARMLESTPELIVQEWVEGPDSHICFSLFNCAPRSVTGFVGRKLASHPPLVGHTTLCLPAPEVVKDLESLVSLYLEATNFEGLGSLEFKWDARQRRYVVIGQTVGHTDRHGEIATLSGVDLFKAAYDDAVGQPSTPPSGLDRNVAWRESALLGRNMPVLSPGTKVYDGYWRAYDPMPGFYNSMRTRFAGLRRFFGRRKIEDDDFEPGIGDAQSMVQRKIY